MYQLTSENPSVVTTLDGSAVPSTEVGYLTAIFLPSVNGAVGMRCKYPYPMPQPKLNYK